MDELLVPSVPIKVEVPEHQDSYCDKGKPEYIPERSKDQTSSQCDNNYAQKHYHSTQNYGNFSGSDIGGSEVKIEPFNMLDHSFTSSGSKIETIAQKLVNKSRGNSDGKPVHNNSKATDICGTIMGMNCKQKVWKESKDSQKCREEVSHQDEDEDNKVFVKQCVDSRRIKVEIMCSLCGQQSVGDEPCSCSIGYGAPGRASSESIGSDINAYETNNYVAGSSDKYLGNMHLGQWNEEYSGHSRSASEQILPSQSNINAQVGKHNEEMSSRCTSCDKTFTSLEELQCHRIKTHSIEEPYNHITCKDLDKVESNGVTRTSNRPYSCTLCTKTFILSGHLKRHLRTHTGEKPYSCTMCDRKFIDSCHLTKHMRSHTGEKPFKCSMCDRTFIQTSHLKNHMAAHTSEKTYFCPVCDKPFIRADSLTRHKRTHTGVRPFKCAWCDKSFLDSRQMRMHERTHTGEKPYKCTVDQCERTFAGAHSLKRHLQTHTGERPYGCSVCGKHFATIGDQKIHMRIHTGEKPYSCHLCEWRFTQINSLKSHMKRHTGKKL